uniref:DUF7431 domain-containing protein n=1 Tax=Rhizophagus irregularis (strain DAOM 181602 / DAOM 197198 / MUCL 43194) TaxID=747089 RepID=U9UQ34_RHIID
MSFLIDSNAIVTVKTIVDPPSYPPPSARTVRLNLENNLSIIRQELKDKKFIDNTLLFSKKYQNSKEASMKVNAGGTLEVNAAGTAGYSEAKSNHYKSNYTKLIGGEQSDLENFDEKAWFKTLENYKNWDCIELQGLISIFQPIPDYLRKKIIESVGKRIHHSGFKVISYNLEKFGKPKIFEFKDVIPPNILNIIQNKEADCNVFATVIDMEKSQNNFFTCQVLCSPGGIPNLIIHCIQKKFKKRQCKLKIIWMISILS